MTEKDDIKRGMIETGKADAPSDEAKVRWVPTPDSLDRAHRLAAKLGYRFDARQTEAHGRDLLRHYFDDLRRVLPEVTPYFRFDHGSRNELQASIGLVEDHARVFIDEHLHFWLLGLNFIATVSACYDLEKEDEEALRILTADHFRMYADPVEVHYRVREALWPWHERFTKLLEVANAVTQTMTVFTLCHEVAHSYLGHLHELDEPDHEIAADSLAFEYLLRIHRYRDDLQFAQIDASTLCAPCQFFSILHAARVFTLGSDSATDSHPSALDRRQALIERTRARWPDTSVARFEAVEPAFQALHGVGTSFSDAYLSGS